MNRRRRLGQHILVDTAVQDSIIKAAELEGSEVVYEIGTGLGSMTRKLCGIVARVISSELDPNLHKEASERLREFRNLTLIRGDGFSIDVKFNVLISNLPYSESARFIKWLLSQKIKRAVVLVQKEFAEKIIAKPGSKVYRAITVLAQYAFDIIPLDNVQPEAFSPPPKVLSKILVFKPKTINPLSDGVQKKVNLLFSYRRKRVSTAVKHILGPSALTLDIWEDKVLDKRVKDLTIVELVDLATYLVAR